MQFKVAHISLLSFAGIQHCQIKYSEQVILTLKKGGTTMSRSFIVLLYIPPQKSKMKGGNATSRRFVALLQIITQTV